MHIRSDVLSAPPPRIHITPAYPNTHQPCGQPGACPYAALGGAVLLAPPSSLPRLAAASQAPLHYGDAVRITPLLPPEAEEEGSPLMLIARLRPLLTPPASPCAAPCVCSAQAAGGAPGGAGGTVVLPRGLLVVVAVAGGMKEEEEGAAAPQPPFTPLPSVFQARIEPLVAG